MINTESLIGDVKEAAVPTDRKEVLDGAYARYVLCVLLLVNILSYIDRNLLAALAESIKQDLKISDADLGFLFGTAFAVFFSTFGLISGRLADTWNRTKLISCALTFWSLMTALSATARSFVPLAFYRFGVGAGESCSVPAAVSILCDYFSPRRRTTALAIYMSGLVVGGGLGLILGGQVLNAWTNAWPDSSLAPFGLKGWQATFLLLGLPGLLVSFWVWTLREPVRGLLAGVTTNEQPLAHPGREILLTLTSVLPIANLVLLYRVGGLRPVIINMLAAAVLIFIAHEVISLTGDTLQWVAVGMGLFAAFSWAQVLSYRDPVVFGMMFRCTTTVCLYLGCAALIFKYVILFWCVPYFQRYYGVSVAQVTTVMGIGSVVCGFIGTVIGGVLSDTLRTRTPRGKLFVLLGSMVFAMTAGFILLTVHNLTIAYAMVLCVNLSAAMATGPMSSAMTDLVLPRARSTTVAFQLMASAVLGTSIMPYVIGLISDSIAATGVSSGESLRQGMLYGMTLPVLGMVALIIATVRIKADEASLVSRARALGEPI